MTCASGEHRGKRQPPSGPKEAVVVARGASSARLRDNAPDDRSRRAIPDGALHRAARRQINRRVGPIEGRFARKHDGESFHGLYTWDLIYPKGPWHGLSDVEFATLEYVDWFNHPAPRRDHRPPRLHHPRRLRGRLLLFRKRPTEGVETKTAEPL